jgi:hypothetical protein
MAESEKRWRSVLWLEMTEDGQSCRWLSDGSYMPKFTVAAALVMLQNEVSSIFPPGAQLQDSGSRWTQKQKEE